jgi:chaperonin GroES
MAKKLSVMPIGDRVLIRPLEVEKEAKTASGIILPDSGEKEAPSSGEVLAVGPGKFDDGVQVPMQIKVGDTVLFSKYGYEEVGVDGEDLYIISESNILAVTK